MLRSVSLTNKPLAQTETYRRYELAASPSFARQADRLPHNFTAIRVISGSAWVSYQSKDLFLEAGDELVFERRNSHDAVISNIGKRTLIIEARLH